MTQDDLAKSVQVSRAAVATYEAGRTPFDIIYLDRLREVGLRINYVLTGRSDGEVASELFDWDVARELALAIDDFSIEAGLQLSTSKRFALLRILYSQAARDRVVDMSRLAEVARLAA